MPRKRRRRAKQVAKELAEIALKHLKTPPEEEKELRISAAERAGWLLPRLTNLRPLQHHNSSVLFPLERGRVQS
jgi:hypothetical protein